MLVGERILVAGAIFSVIIGIFSLERGDSSRAWSWKLLGPASPLKSSSGRLSADGDENAGNLKFCGYEIDPVRRENAFSGIPGVLGVVAAPVCRLACRSVGSGENEDISGDGCVEDLWFIGATYISLYPFRGT
jgi:hypothetical protein